MHIAKLTILVTATMLLAPAAAQARILAYWATPSGDPASAKTRSRPTATAQIYADVDATTLAVRMQVSGMPMTALWDTFVAAPIGPVHLHQYADVVFADPNTSLLAFPLPFGPSYQATEDGFTVDTGPQSCATGMATLGSKASFEEFVTALDRSTMVLNIHTDAFNTGETSGPVIKAKN